jgi:putative serine protease PepD
MTQNPYGQQPGPRQESPWWAHGAQNEPWRDPRSPSYTSPTQQLPQPPWAPAGPAQPASPAARPSRGRMGAVIAVALVTGLLSGGVAGVAGSAIIRQPDNGIVTPRKGTPLGAPAAANRAPGSIADIAATTLPSVVSIQTSSASAQGTGSGFVIKKDGYILTNNHVVASAADGGEIKVVFKDGSSAPGKIVGRDPYSDIAVVKVSKTDLKAVTLGDSSPSSVAVGDPVVAVGSPLGLAGTVTSGIISALDRPVRAGGSESNSAESAQTFISAIQTDAAINPGNSGGPLLDGDARVIGVNSAIATLTSGGGQAGSIGLGFAIPINQAKRVAEQLISSGKATRTVIGASVDSGTTGSVDGVKLGDITANGPAAKAGLHQGDIITEFGGKIIDDPVALIAQIRAQEPGSTVKVTYYRDGRKATTTVTLGAA